MTVHTAPMGRQSKRKARDRHGRAHRRRTTGGRSRDPAALIGAAFVVWQTDADAYEQVAQQLAEAGPHAVDAVRTRTAAVIDGLWDHGWTPAAVLHVVGRQLGTHHTGAAASAILRDRARQERDGLHAHPRWQQEVEAIAADHGPLHDTDPVQRLLDVLCLLVTLGAVTRVLPRPSRQLVDGMTVGRGLDQRMLARVRALLAKAESTEFEQEAEALSAKAQELITRHAIADVLEHATHHGRASDDSEEPSARRILIADPYADAKAALVAAVGRANRSRCVQLRDYGWVTVFGYDRDLDAVEMLSASLLVQATGAMSRYGPTRDAAGRSTTRSFRRAFLFGFAHRIGERLTRAAEQEVAAAATGRGDVLPVLAARDDRVEAAQQAAFPKVTRRRSAVSNGSGWVAGQAAADAADLTVPGARLPAGGG